MAEQHKEDLLPKSREGENRSDPRTSRSDAAPVPANLDCASPGSVDGLFNLLEFAAPCDEESCGQ